MNGLIDGRAVVRACLAFESDASCLPKAREILRRRARVQGLYQRLAVLLGGVA